MTKKKSTSSQSVATKKDESFLKHTYTRSLWYKTDSDSSALAHKIKYEKNFRNDRWSERLDSCIKNKQHLPRLAVAMENLPAPGAFRAAAIALRALIRERRDKRESFEDELTLLYWLAAVWSFAKHELITYSAETANLLQIVPAKVFKTLPFAYEDLGYRELDLLTKTDARLLTDVWGVPKTHQTLCQMYPDVFEKYHERSKFKRKPIVRPMSEVRAEWDEKVRNRKRKFVKKIAPPDKE
jgi:hypothetical protein